MVPSMDWREKSIKETYISLHVMTETTYNTFRVIFITTIPRLNLEK